MTGELALNKKEVVWVLGQIQIVRYSNFSGEGDLPEDSADWDEDHYEGISHSEFVLIKGLYEKLKKATQNYCLTCARSEACKEKKVAYWCSDYKKRAKR